MFHSHLACDLRRHGRTIAAGYCRVGCRLRRPLRQSRPSLCELHRRSGGDQWLDCRTSKLGLSFVWMSPMDNLALCLSQASFGVPDAFIPDSAWIEHTPLAFWIIDQHRPGLLAELGTHTGYSYLCFCQQVLKSKLPTQCFAVDTWRGDVHAGFYGEEVFDNLVRYHNPRYGAFSRLLRSSFEAAVGQFADGSIDLLHLDGRHFYEDVRQDFESWRPKLSGRAIVLFHDTQVRERGFGVYRFWQEISSGLPHFEFTHGHGLGVLGFGPAVAKFSLFSVAGNAAAVQEIRVTYARLGRRLHRRQARQGFSSVFSWLR